MVALYVYFTVGDHCVMTLYIKYYVWFLINLCTVLPLLHTVPPMKFHALLSDGRFDSSLTRKVTRYQFCF